MIVSVIIPVYNREQFIKKCLLSLLDQTATDYEIIVVDDGSTDNTLAIARSIESNRVRILHHPVNKGLAYSRNKGTQKAQGKFIAFIDSDCEASPQWLEALLKPFFMDPSIMITGGRIIDPPANTYWELVNAGADVIDSKSGYVNNIIGCNMSYRAEFLRKSPFELECADERDQCLKCLEQQRKIFYVHDASVTHYHRKTLKDSLIQHFRWGQYNAILNIKHRIFPILNYGTFILLASILFLLLGKMFLTIGWMCIGAYIGLAGYWNTRKKTRLLNEWALTYPGYLLMFCAFCIGNLSFFLRKGSLNEKPA